MRVSFSLPVLVAAVVVVSMSTLGGALMWQGWSAARTALVDAAHDRTLAIGERIEERFERRLTPGRISLRHLARGPLVAAASLEERLARLPVLAELVTNLPAAAAVLIGYADGDFLLVRPFRSPQEASAFAAPANAAYLVQSITREAGGEATESWLFFDGDLRLVETRAQAPSGYDPRTRPWYKGAMESSRQYLTSPYRFFTTREIGLTQSLATPGHDAVVALEQNLSDLALTLASLRLTPRTELAVVGDDGSLYGYMDSGRSPGPAGEGAAPTSVADLDATALVALAASGAAPRQTVSFEADGASWFGVRVPLVLFEGRGLALLVAVPDTDLLAGARSALARQLWVALGLMFALLVIGWLVGRWLGRSLTGLTHQAERLTRFDFSASPPSDSRISEVRQLDAALARVCRTIETFLATAETMGSEPGLDRMLEKVLEQTVAATGSTAGAVYLVNAAGNGLARAAVAVGPGREMTKGHFSRELPLAILADQAGDEAPMMSAEQRPYAQPLRSRQNEPVGLLLLEHPAADVQVGEDFRAFAERLSGALSSAIETRQLFEAQKNLLDGFVLLIADAIDAKSPYTGGHCRRVPELATMIVDRMSGETEGPYRDFHFNEAQRYEFHLGAWLHDCGKVTSPEHIIDKATKLEAIHNRIHEVRTRFEVLWRDEEIAHLQRLLDGAAPEGSKAMRDAAQAVLREDFAFVAASNVGGEFMSEEAIARIRTIAGRTWLRHFDDRLGLSVEELRQLDGAAARPLPAQETLLADRPEHVVPWGRRRPPVGKGDPANAYGFDMACPEHRANKGELYNLSIGRGTLTAEDRFAINDHVVQTYVMLKSLPWPAHLSRVPEIAATHHERMDGKGYPRHLSAADLSTEERVMALADIFEALTASDRPYKPAKTLSQSLRIMAFMCKEGHLDPEAFRYFLESRLWAEYAARYLKDEQQDAVDVATLIALFANDADRARAAG